MVELEFNNIYTESINHYKIASKVLYNKLVRSNNERYKLITPPEDLKINKDSVIYKIEKFEKNFYEKNIKVGQEKGKLIFTNKNFILKEKEKRKELEIFDISNDLNFIFDEFDEGINEFKIKIINSEHYYIASEDKEKNIVQNSNYIERMIFSRYIEDIYLKEESKTMFLKKILDSSMLILKSINDKELTSEKINFLFSCFQNINIDININKELIEIDDIFKVVFDHSFLIKNENKPKLIKN